MTQTDPTTAGRTILRSRTNPRAWLLGVQWESSTWTGASHAGQPYTRVWIRLLCWEWVVTRFRGTVPMRVPTPEARP